MGDAVITRGGSGGDNIAIVQVLGTSETSVLSQKASTNLLAEKNHTHSLSDLNVYSKQEVDSAISTAISNITDGDEVSY